MVKLKFTKKALGALALTVLMLFSNINNVQAQNVCKIGTTEYTTIQAAVTAASDDAEIQLITDALIDNTITISKNITIDMAGHDITVNATGYAFAVNGKTFKIKDSTFNNAISSEIISSGSSKGLVSLNSQSTLDFSNFSVHGASNATAAYRTNASKSDAIIFDNNNYDDDIKLTNVNIYTANTIIGSNTGDREEASAKLTISGGIFTCWRGFTFKGSNSTIDGINITVNGSGSNGEGAIYTLGSATLSNSVISGSTGNDALVTTFGSSAILTINNTTVTANGAAEAAVQAQYGSSITINGGTYTSYSNKSYGAVVKTKPGESSTKMNGNITVNSGFLDSHTTSGYALYSNGDGVTNSRNYGYVKINNSSVTVKGKANVSGNYAYVYLANGKYQEAITLYENSSSNLAVRITGNVTLDVAAGGMLKYSSGNIPESYITADMTGVTAASVKLIEYTGSGAKTYNNVTLVNGENYKKEVKDDNDLYAVLSPSTSDLAVDDDWATGKTKGDPVVFGNKTYFFGYNAFGTIQAAVNAADVSEGAVTINVAEGTYNENVSFYVYQYPNGLGPLDNLKFTDNTGEWYGRLHFIAEEGKTVTLNGQFSPSNDQIKYLADIQITGFTFNNQSIPAYFEASGLPTASTIKDIVISNNTINYPQEGAAATYGSIYLNSGLLDNITVSGNTITGAVGDGNNKVGYSISIGNRGSENSPYQLNNIKVSGNTITGSGAERLMCVNGQILSDGVLIGGTTEGEGNNFGASSYNKGYSIALWVRNNSGTSTGKMNIAGNTFSSDLDVEIAFRDGTQKGDFVIGEGNKVGENLIEGWAETSAKKYLVNTNASNRNAVYYSNRLYLGNETAFTTIKAAYDAAPDDGILIINGNEVAKSSIDMSTLGVNSAWSSLEDGQAVTVEGETFYGGLNAYSTVAAATAAVQTGQTVKLFSNITGSAVDIPGGTFLNTNTKDLTATNITMGSNFTVNATGLEELTTYWVMFYNASGNWAGNDKITTAAGQTSITIVKKDVSYASSRTYNADTWELSGTTTYATTFGTLELDGESTVTFSGTLTNSGTITVDMTDATENTYKLMDYTGTGSANYGLKGSGYKFAEGKDNGYTLQVIDNDLVAYKSTTSKAAVAIKSEWAGTAFGTEVTLNGTNYTYGISGFSNFTDALGATDATTTSVVINGETFGKPNNTGTLYLTNTSGEVMNVSTVGAAVSSYPEDFTGTYLSVGSGSEKQNYNFTEGSDLTVFQFYTGGSSNIDITVDGALKTEGSILLNGANVTVSKNGSLSIDGSHRPSANGTIFDNGAVLTVNGALNLNINDVPNTPEPLRIKIGGDGADNDGIALIVDGGTATVHGVENTTGVEKFSKNPATTVIGGSVDDEGTAATLSVTNGGLYDTDGTIINNGVIKIDVKKDDNNRYSKVMTKDITNTGTITIDMTGATEASYKVIDYTGEGPKTIADYGTVTFTGGTATYYAEVKENDLYATKAVASITAGETTTYYATLADAIEAAQSTDVITMLVNISDNVTIPAEKTVTLDLNGKVISALDEAKNVITNNGNLTLTDGIGGGNITGGKVGVEQNDALTLSGKVNITGNGTGDNRCNLYLPSSDKTFLISDPAEGMKVGVSKYGDPSVSDITLTGANTADYSRYFFSDNPNYSVKNTESNVLVLTNGVLVTLTATEGGKVELYVNGEYAGTSAYVTLNSTVTIKAKASDGYAFKGWYKKDDTMFNGKFSHTFNATESLDLEAKFTDQVIWVRVKKGN